jgi:hypothetical protein
MNTIHRSEGNSVFSLEVHKLKIEEIIEIEGAAIGSDRIHKETW